MSPNMDHHVALIREDFNVLSKVIVRQAEAIQLFLSEIVGPKAYEYIKMNETVIDSLEVKTRNEIINGAILYVPCTSETRRIPALHGIASCLEHIGNLLFGVADFTRTIDMGNGLHLQYANMLRRILAEAYRMAIDAVTSFFVGGSELSRSVIDQSTHIDDLHYQTSDPLPQTLLNTEQSPGVDSIQASLTIGSIAHNLEHIDDSVTSIAEATIFHSEGKNLPHTKSQEVEIPTEQELENYGQKEV